MLESGERIVLMIDFNDLPNGTVATLEEIIDKIGVIRYDEGDKFMGVPLDLLRSASKEEIQQTSYRKLIDKKLWQGCRWRSHIKLSKDNKKGTVFVISSVSLQSNKNQDLITIHPTNDIVSEKYPIVISSSALQEYCIYHNPFLEDSLAEEISDNGEHIFFRPGQRVICNGKVANIIEVNEEIKEAKVCFDLRNFSLTNINLINMKNITAEDLANSDYQKLIDKKLYINCKWKAKNELPLSEYQDTENNIVESIKYDEEITILSINRLTSYVLEDSFIISYKDMKIELTTYDILSNFINI